MGYFWSLEVNFTPSELIYIISSIFHDVTDAILGAMDRLKEAVEVNFEAVEAVRKRLSVFKQTMACGGSNESL